MSRNMTFVRGEDHPLDSWCEVSIANSFQTFSSKYLRRSNSKHFETYKYITLNLKLFAALLIIYNRFCYTKISFAPVAIQQFIENHFVKNSIKFEIIYDSKASNILDRTLKLISDLKASRISRVGSVGKKLFTVSHSAVLLFHNFENYLRFEDRIRLPKNGPQIVNLFIVCANLSTSEVEQNLPSDKYQIRQYLIQERGEISLKATTLFTPRACKKQQLIEITIFRTQHYNGRRQSSLCRRSIIFMDANLIFSSRIINLMRVDLHI